MSYCRSCGKQRVQEWTGAYREDTGEKQMREVCPDSPCDHDGHVWRLDTTLGFWRTMFCEPFKCERCGKKAALEMV